MAILQGLRRLASLEIAFAEAARFTDSLKIFKDGLTTSRPWAVDHGVVEFGDSRLEPQES